MRYARIPEQLDSHLAELWSRLTEPEKTQCADAVRDLSTYFQQEQGPLTPWDEARFRNAYLFYFFPLNLARASQVFQSLVPLYKDSIEHVVDMGAGLGNFSYLKGLSPAFKDSQVYSLERDRKATDHGIELLKAVHPSVPSPKVISQFKDIAKLKNSCAFFSYSWLEMKIQARDLKDFQSLIFIEPSTQMAARSLQSFRQELLDQGFHVVAPCTHEQECPLLTKSQRDWCHDRVHFEKPTWYLDLENRLPMKNQTLTYSYLVLSKSKTKFEEGFARVIGDTMKEKGKSRQAVCFDNERRFLSWLKKNFPEVPHVDHGALIQMEEAQILSGEVRNPKYKEIY